MSQKNNFLASFSPFFKTATKTVTYLIQYIATLIKIYAKLDHILEFQPKKPPRSRLKWYFLMVRELLKIKNLETTKPISVKLARYMYHLNTWIEGVNWWTAEKCIKKTTKNAMNLIKCWYWHHLKTVENSSWNDAKVEIFLQSSITYQLAEP